MFIIAHIDNARFVMVVIPTILNHVFVVFCDTGNDCITSSEFRYNWEGLFKE